VKPSYKELGWVHIPPPVMASTDIGMGEKVLWGKILGLIGEKGYCWAGNKWLAEQLGFTKATVSTYICNLVDRGYLRREVIRAKDGQGKIIERRLFPVSDHSPVGVGLWSDTPIGSISEGSGDSMSGDTKKPSASRAANTFSPDWYRENEADYQRIKGVTLTGPEFGPLQQGLKTCYMAGHEPVDVRGLMEALEASPEEWTQNWTINTVRMKLAEWKAGKLRLDAVHASPQKRPGTSRGKAYYLGRQHEGRVEELGHCSRDANVAGLRTRGGRHGSEATEHPGDQRPDCGRDG